MAGPAAERVVYGDISTGIEGDLEEATSMARDMVARYGMAAGLENTRLLAPDSSAYLGEDTPWGDIAEETKASADAAIRSLLAEAVSEATTLLQRHRPALELVAEELRTHETLEGVTLLTVLDAATQAMSGKRSRKAARV